MFLTYHKCFRNVVLIAFDLSYNGARKLHNAFVANACRKLQQYETSACVFDYVKHNCVWYLM